MTIIDEIFKKSLVDFNKLVPYGFCFKNNEYFYETTFMNGSFKASIKIDKTGKISGEVFDLENGEIYYPLKVKNPSGAYIGQVKNEYEKILEHINTHCFKKNSFIYPQSNRISEYILKKYGASPLFMWDVAPGFGVFKNTDNEKWFGIIMNIDYSKLDKSLSGEIEIINLKLEKSEIETLLQKKGFYPAWHMNKKSWISLVLDGTLSDKTVQTYLDKSYICTQTKKRKSK